METNVDWQTSEKDCEKIYVYTMTEIYQNLSLIHLFMSIPPYLKQENESTCSLAVLRMALAHFGKTVSEGELVSQVKEEYGEKFSNIWNPTIAKLACEYGLKTTFFAEWPLLKPELLSMAMREYVKNPVTFNVRKYENESDHDSLPEPLPLAYKEMFLAIEKGCTTIYGGLTKERITSLLSDGHLIQTSIKLHILYPGKKHAFHSILLYGLERKVVSFHDPYHGEQLNCSIDHLLQAASDVGAFMAYTNIS